MPNLDVHIKHAGKTYNVLLDPDQPPVEFKKAIYVKTGVPPERMKVMVKGGVLKDDASWIKIGPKQGQTFTVIGAAGELPKPPENPTVFLEDMADSELAEVLSKPVGLTNLGNTCYMNSSIQAFRAIPELQIALNGPTLQSSTPIPNALRDLYKEMSQTTDSIYPSRFLQILREVNPQFAELDRTERTSGGLSALLGRGYSQQDAEECYSTILNSLTNISGLDSAGVVVNNVDGLGRKRFVDQYLMGELHRELRCDETKEETPVTAHEKILKIECNINASTNFLLNGIMSSFDQKIEKASPSLGRQAVYSQKLRVSRLPTYLTVHMVRFCWRADIGKKTKIMKKVRFPVELDALELTTEDYQKRLLPASIKLKEIEEKRLERRKLRTKTKTVAGSTTSAAVPNTSTDVEMAEPSSTQVATTPDTPMGDVSEAKEPAQGAAADKEEDEFAIRQKEVAEFLESVDENIKADIGASSTGLYELVAIVTHKGAAADGGHYMGFVKRNSFTKSKLKEKLNAESSKSEPDTQGDGEGEKTTVKITEKELDEVEGDEDWYKFDDDKVSIFPKEKLAGLDGGGEDSSAYLLLYKSKTA